MRKYGNEDPESLSYYEYMREVAAGNAPDFIKYVMSHKLVTGVGPGDESKFDNIKIEQVQVFGTSETNFVIKCTYQGLEIRYECVAFKMNNSAQQPVWRIKRTYTFEVYVPSTNEIHVSKFDGRGREIGQEVIQSYGRPGSAQRKVMEKRKQFSFAANGDPDAEYQDNDFQKKKEALAQKPVVRYESKNQQFVCSCWDKNTLPWWCTHVDAYIEAGLDAPTLESLKLNMKLNALDIQYPLARGLAHATLTLEKFTEREILGTESEAPMLRLTWKDLSVWDSGGDLCGELILSQIKGSVRNSQEYENWTLRVKHGFLITETPCGNTFHMRSDTDVFDTMRTEAKLPEEKDAIAFVNAFHSIYNGCCLACFQVRNRMADDVPRY